MSTLHAILDDPSSPFAPSRMEIQLDDPDAPLPARNSVILRGKGGLSPQGGSAPPAAAVGAAAALIAGGGGRGSLAGGPSNLQKRKPLDVLCGYEMDRILAVSLERGVYSIPFCIVRYMWELLMGMTFVFPCFLGKIRETCSRRIERAGVMGKCLLLSLEAVSVARDLHPCYSFCRSNHNSVDTYVNYFAADV